MNRFLFTLSCLFLLPFSGAAQKSVSELPRGQASALQEFLTKHPDLEFLSETALDKEILKEMRKNFEPRLTPYYRQGDFNRDRIQDFALILVKEGRPRDLGKGIAETHRYEFNMTVVIFNGQKGGGYSVGFTKKVDAPLPCFLYVTYEKTKKLYFAIYETDAHFIMTPAGRGYIAEYEPH